MGLRRRNAIDVPSAGPGIVKRVAEVWAAFVGRDGEVDIPAGWQHLSNDEHGNPLYGWTGPPWRRPDLERLAEAVRRRHGG